MRELARVAVFPAMLVGALGATAWAISTGAPPAAAVFLLYLAMMPVVAGLERWLPHRPEWNEAHGDQLTDALYLPTTWGLGALLAPAFAAVAVVVEGGLHGMVGDSVWPQHWPVAVQVVLACAVAEFFDYWGHRWMHRVPALWRFHSIHHSAKRVYWLNATRTHPGELLVRGLLGGVPLAVLGVGEQVFAYGMVLGRVAGLFQHANIDFRLGVFGWIFSIGDLHRWHHSCVRAEADQNYGNSFILWDVVFGTRFLPADRAAPAEVGLSGLEAFPMDYTGLALAPFRYREIEAASAPPRDPA